MREAVGNGASRRDEYRNSPREDTADGQRGYN